MTDSTTTAASAPAKADYTPPSKDIAATVRTADSLTTLATALNRVGESAALHGTGRFTLFAPSDRAFEKLPRGALDALFKNARKLKAVLDYHLIAGHFLAQDLQPGERMTLQGTTLTVVLASSGVQINGAGIEQADLVATNGVLHIIDQVILPKHWQLLAVAA
jgi:uncharacterized surface protein with fasciclin (FAS1) repeats